MKKDTLAIMLVVLVAGASLVYAEGMKGEMMDQGMKGNMMGEGMMGKEMMDGKMGGKMMKGSMHEMMESMMKRSVTATSDGGVVVLFGNKLTKYDKDLNVVKEVELKMDMEGMQKMMGDMKGMCPMMGKGKMNDMDDDDDDAVKADPQAPVAPDDVDHASHH